MLTSSHDKERLASWIKGAKSMVVLTGAGISTESGIPDFRSKNGLYQKQNAFYRSILENEYDRFYGFCKDLFGKYGDSQPNAAHEIMAKWEDESYVSAVITQNIDGLHQKAGSRNVLELHGTMNRASCMDCGKPAPARDFYEKIGCQYCGGRLRPDIVLFGDQLPEDILKRSFQYCQEADLVLVIGSSLIVSPACDLPFHSRGKKVLINKDEVDKKNMFDLLLYGSAGDILKDVDNFIE
ncbi:NAD-dependent protein deacylase [Iocasia frigidifontis]|uniref:protein acetyllysine N-acetyltransferase n=1 Tax=Iocasia fonsfrigidae TaxID=2682810 RepID=A0A8A7KG17_9FIRM|nr:NAD-dependent protein deacylase [Iocasia fonsfrigidae]QTL98648.1 NAD-dependent protein deacylase [Iocasia fonsfrigidae]